MHKQDVSFRSLGDALAGVLFLPDSASPYPSLVVCHGALAYKEIYFEPSSWPAEAWPP